MTSTRDSMQNIIERLVEENEALKAENDMLKSVPPVEDVRLLAEWIKEGWHVPSGYWGLAQAVLSGLAKREDGTSEPRIEIHRIGEDYRVFEVSVNGESVDSWATSDEVLTIVENEIGGYRIMDS